MSPLEIAQDVWVFTSSLYQTTSTVVRTQNHVLIVDPNWLPEEIDHIRNFVGHIGAGRQHILLFTHSDYDHIIGYGAFPGSRVIASRAFHESNHKLDDITQAREWDAERNISRSYPLTYPQVDFVIEHDGQEVRLDEIVMTFYMAPGHTAEGILTCLQPSGILIAGDYLSDIEFPLVQDAGAYRDTLHRFDHILARHVITVMIPGHGSPARSAAEIFARRDVSLEYLDDLEKWAETGAFPASKYQSRYPTWDDLRSWHEDNQRLIRLL